MGDILAKRREERAAKAYRLSKLGWTQKEISGVLDCSQQTVADDLPKIQELGKSVISQLASKLPRDEVALRHGLPLE